MIGGSTEAECDAIQDGLMRSRWTASERVGGLRPRCDVTRTPTSVKSTGPSLQAEDVGQEKQLRATRNNCFGEPKAIVERGCCANSLDEGIGLVPWQEQLHEWIASCVGYLQEEEG